MSKKFAIACLIIWGCSGVPVGMNYIMRAGINEELTFSEFKKKCAKILPKKSKYQEQVDKILKKEWKRDYSLLFRKAKRREQKDVDKKTQQNVEKNQEKQNSDEQEQNVNDQELKRKKTVDEKLFLYSDWLHKWEHMVYLTPNSSEPQLVRSTSWMQWVPNDRFLGFINIFGTHDTAAYRMSSTKKKFAQCQTLSIAEQLAEGVRILDIRLVYDENLNDIFCCHGKGPFQCDCYHKDMENGNDNKKKRIRVSYYDVLLTVCTFLNTHPTETVIIAPKHESGNKTLTTFYTNLIHEMLRERNLAYSEDRVPNLGEVRGKIVIWDKKGSLHAGIKIKTDVKDEQEHSEIKWKVHKQFRLDDGEQKISMINANLVLAEKLAKQGLQNTKSFIMYTSGFATSFFLPNPKKIAMPVNAFLYKREFQYGTHYGWFMMDFVKSRLMKKLILTNFFSPVKKNTEAKKN